MYTISKWVQEYALAVQGLDANQRQDQNRLLHRGRSVAGCELRSFWLYAGHYRERDFSGHPEPNRGACCQYVL